MKKIKNNLGVIIFLILLFSQGVYMIFWGTQKSGYYVDEFFTYDNAHYISASTPERVKLYDADFMEYNKWFDVLEIKSTLMVQREKALLNDSLLDNIKAFVKGKPYMAILNYVEAIFYEEELNWWSSISINIVCFLLNQILMYLLTMKISKKRNTALLAMAMYGFCGMAISMLVYVRMYMWLTMLVTLFTYLHVLMWDEDKHWKNILFEVLSLLVLFLAYRNSPLPVIYGMGLIVCFSIGLLMRKKVTQTLYYSIPYIGGGAIFVITQTNYVEIFMNPQYALSSGMLDSATSGLIQNMLLLNVYEILKRITILLRMALRFLFGHSIIVFAYIILVLGLIYVVLRKRKDVKKDTKKEVKFEHVLYGAVLIFFIGAVIFGLDLIRYDSFVYPMVAVCAMLLIMKLTQLINKERAITVIVTVFIFGQVFFTVSIPRIENLYLEDRVAIQNIQKNSGINSLVIDYRFDDRVMYECLAYTDENTQIMFSSYEDIEYSELGDSILVWQTVNRSSEDLEQNMLNAGYSFVEKIAETHESKVFLCMK